MSIVCKEPDGIKRRNINLGKVDWKEVKGKLKEVEVGKEKEKMTYASLKNIIGGINEVGGGITKAG